MNVSELMSTRVQSCRADDTLQRAMQIMWDHDCGIVPVVDRDGRLTGLVTDRDVAVAAYTQGRPLGQIPVTTAMAKQVHAVRETDSVEAVQDIMRRARVRRVPVVDGQGRLRGIVSLNDLARHVQRAAGRKNDGMRDILVQTLAAVCEPHARPVGKEPQARASAHLPS